MVVPKTLFRILNSQINYEKYIWVMMKNKMYEFEKPKWVWSTTSQACFVAGMEYALKIMEDHTKFDGLPNVDEPPMSDEYKKLANIFYRMKCVDSRLDPMVKNGSIKGVMKHY